MMVMMMMMKMCGEQRPGVGRPVRSAADHLKLCGDSYRDNQAAKKALVYSAPKL